MTKSEYNYGGDIMKTILILAMVFIPTTVFAAPFLVCDPYPSTVAQPTHFILIIDGGSPIRSTPQTTPEGVRLYYDLATISPGTHTVSVKACAGGELWGEVCSAEVPFVFTRPSSPSAPRNISLSR